MTALANLNWLYHSIGWALVMVGLLFGARAFFGDRSRGRRRCPKCWYDMSGVPGLKCPECGREAEVPEDLLRTRRRWALALLALILALSSYPAYFTGRIKQAGWPGAVPTTALIWIVGRYEPPEIYSGGKMSTPTPAASELTRRASDEGMWGWQWRFLLKQLRIIRWRERWPADQPWQVGVSQPSWLGGCRIEVRLPADLWYEDLNAANPPSKQFDVPGIEFPVTTQILSSGTQNVVLDVSISSGTSGGQWRGDVSVPVRLVGSDREAMVPMTNPALDATVRRALQSSINVDHNPKTGTELILGARLFRVKGPMPDDIAIGIVVELMRDGVPIQAWPLRLLDSAYGPPVDWIRISMPPPGWNVDDQADMDRWTVRIRGDAGVSLGDFQRDRFWAGEFTVPLNEFLRK